MLKFNRFGAFPLRSVCVPLINRHMGRVNDVTHCYNLGKSGFPLLICISVFLYIYNEVDRFTNERHSTTIGTIGLPRLARELT